jgi:tetratricopeptide (TPR) repeat protein
MTPNGARLPRALCFAAIGFFAALPACQASRGDEVRAHLDTFHDEGTPAKLVDRGKAFAAIGDSTRAEQYFAAAINAGGDERAILPLLLLVCIRDNRYRVAIEYASTYLKKHPSDLRVHLLLGTLYSAIGDAHEAQKELEQVVEARPADADAHYALAILYRDGENNPVAADQQFREYLRLAPNGSHAEEAQASLLKSVP